MSSTTWLVLYCAAILAASLMGGYLPFLRHVTHSWLQFYLSLAAGVMLGAAFFHVMPEAIELSGPNLFGWWMSLGTVGLFCIERFIAPHSHEVNGSKGDQKWHPTKDLLDHGHPHYHEHETAPGHAHEPRAAAPPVAGWMAVLGLTIHTFMNGVGLAGEVQVEASKVFWPGLAIFLAIVLHKPADALAISTVLSRKGTNRRVISLVQFGFAAMIPIGVLAFHVSRGAIAESLESQLTGAALAFSAGTFLFIALSDLLPEVQFHTHDRLWLFLALVLGVVGMGGIALLEDHGHDSHERSGQVTENAAGHDQDRDHEN